LKDFDDARRVREQETRDERAFTLGGETFYARMTVRPEAYMRWDSLDVEAATPTEILAVADETIVAMIENVDRASERYYAVRASEDDPVGMKDLTDLIQWLVEVQTGRPTEQPPVSSGSPESDGPTSTDGSSLPETPEESLPST
jgi:hypothetical protein